MFATIETNGATHIAIYIPHQGADVALPAIAAMLEQNTTFIRQGYQELNTVKPKMAITLGDRYHCENYDVEITIAESGAVISDDFVPASPEVFTSNAKALKKRDDDISRMRTEISFLKQQIEAKDAALKSYEDAARDAVDA